MIVSLYYYLRVVRAMFMEPQDAPIETIKTDSSVKLGLFICAAGIILLGIFSWVYDHIQFLS
jgi:NADH-quinone oxidoreductase subunit N